MGGNNSYACAASRNSMLFLRCIEWLSVESSLPAVTVAITFCGGGKFAYSGQWVIGDA
jgi:hypothetical protein